MSTVEATSCSRQNLQWKTRSRHWKKEIAPTDFEIDRSDQFFCGVRWRGWGVTSFFGGGGHLPSLFPGCPATLANFFMKTLRALPAGPHRKIPDRAAPVSGRPGDTKIPGYSDRTAFPDIKYGAGGDSPDAGNSPVFLLFLVIRRDHPVDPTEPGKRAVTRIVWCRVAFKADQRSRAITPP